MKLIRLGELNGKITDRLKDLTGHWEKAGFTVQAYEDIQKLIWEKFLCNVTFSAPCTVFEKTVGELMDDPLAWPVALGAMDEAYKIGTAKRLISVSTTQFNMFPNLERICAMLVHLCFWIIWQRRGQKLCLSME